MNKNESKYFNTARKMDDALVELLQEKSLEFITVKEICQRAGVNRSTFYLHYETIGDLLAECAEAANARFLSYFEHDERAHDFIEGIGVAPLDDLVLVKPGFLVPYLSFVRDNRAIFAAAYYALLGAMGLYVLANARKRGSGNAGRVARRCGFGMFLLAVVISGVVCMCIAETRNSSYHMIVMIALATYAFYSATMSIIGAVRSRKGDETQRVLRKLSLASTIGSMLMLEFSMLGTFGDPSSTSSLIMEAATGAGAVILLLLLGRSLIVQSRAPGVNCSGSR